MSKTQYVHHLKEEDAVHSRFCILHQQPSSGNRPHTFMLRDRTGDIPAIIWPRSSPILWSDIRAAQYADIGGMVQKSRYTDRLEVNVQSFARVEDPGDLAEYLPSYSGDDKILRQDLYRMVTSVTQPTLRALLERLFHDDEGFRRAYYSAPAAQQMHHAYIHGLLEHSLEVARFCAAAAQSLPCLNRDLLVTAALLHDIGKLEEIDGAQPSFPFTPSGGMLGHVFLGAHRIYTILGQLDGCPPGLADALCHLLLSHQGKPEWGAPIHPCFAEAYVLHAADALSAQLHHCRQAVAQASGAHFQKVSGLDGRIYTGPLPWSAPDTPWPTEVPSDRSETPPPLRLVEGGEAAEIVFLPLRGSVAAGYPNSEEETLDEKYPLPRTGTVREGDYLLRVRGESMIDAHILDGDIVQVRPNEPVRDGDIVVALVDGESTVKQLVRQGGQVLLRPANPQYPDIHPGEEMTIQGKVIGVLRGIL